MIKRIFVIIFGLIIGSIIGYFLIQKTPEQFHTPLTLTKNKNQVIGFLPYWLSASANKDYTKYLTTLTYFGLTIDSDGKILKLTNPTEEEPGWTSIRTGKMNIFFDQALKNNTKLSITAFSANEKTIGEIISSPIEHSKNLINDMGPVMKKYGFKDLNLDIESVNLASDEARQNFITFVKETKKNLNQQNLGTLTIDVSPTALIKKYLIDLTHVGNIADNIVLMTYDYHYQGSYVTGPVSPVGGAGVDAEFDTITAINEAIKIIPPDKIFIGTPLYGYEWETIGNTPRSAVIPGSGLTASNRRVEEFITNCSTCAAQLDKSGKENYLIYKDFETNTFHQFFYPDINAMKNKIQLANQYKVGGIALWALGYEGNTILNPLEQYLLSNRH